MITKYVLIVWIGASQSQTITTNTFDTLAECEAVRSAIYDVTDTQKDWHICKPYTFDGASQ